MREPKKPTKPYKPTKPSEPTKVYKQTASCVLPISDNNDTVLLSNIISRIPNNTPLDEARISLYIDRDDDYSDVTLYLEYPESKELSDDLYERYMKKYLKDTEKYHINLEKYEIKLKDWKIKNKEYQEKHVLWLKEIREKEIKNLEKRLNKLKKSQDKS